MQALREIGRSEDLWACKYEELHVFFTESLRRAASKLGADLTEEQEGRLLYYVVRESLYSVLVPFMIDENIESIKVEEPEFNALVVHKDYRSLGWLKTNAAFAGSKQFDEFVEGLTKASCNGGR